MTDDAQLDTPARDALAELIVACVKRAAAEVDAGEAPPDLPHRLIEENMWRAIRYGMDGRLIDFDRGVEFEARALPERLLTWTAPARAQLGIEPAVAAENGAQRQRAALLGGAELREVYADSVRETTTTYAQEVPA